MFWSDKMYELNSSYLTEADEEESGFKAPTSNGKQNTEDEDDENYSLDGADNMEDGEDQTQDAAAENQEGDPPAPEDDGDDENYSLDGADNMEDGETEPAEGDQNTEPPQEDTQQANADDQDPAQAEDDSQNTGEPPAPEDDGDDENYSLDGAENMEGGETEPAEGDQSGTEDGSYQDGDGQSNTPPDPRQKLRDLENSIFDQLAEDQKHQKIKELKDLFQSAYYDCQKILTNIDKVEKTPDNVKIYDYVSKALTDLSVYIKDYLEDVFDNRTYIENATELEKYIAVFDGIKNVFVELRKQEEHNEKDK